jgi:protein-tyrosine phosphatase
MFLADAIAAGSVRELDVPDPYYTGGFDFVYKLIYAGCEALLERIQDEHGL